MGLFRLLLAISVLATHLGIQFGFGGRTSVQIFFVISGFLMSYLVTEKRSYATNRNFWASRFFRIFPTYWLVCLCTIFLTQFGVSSNALSVFLELSPPNAIFAIGPNLGLFFQDVMLFLGVASNGEIVFAPNFQSTQLPLHLVLIVPQSWSLALELSFYLIAPFILKRKGVLFALLGLSVLIRLLLVIAGLGLDDPWSYRFFPVEIGTFIFGALIHQLGYPLLQKMEKYNTKIFRLASVIGVIALFALTSFIQSGFVQSVVLALFCSFALPALFKFQSESKFDNELGKLSYPFYMWHVLVIACVYHVLPDSWTNRDLITFAVATIFSLAISALTVWQLDSRVDRMRAKFRESQNSEKLLTRD